MQKLAKREEQIMQALWQLEKAFIKDLIAELPAPQPHYNTVATMIKILEDKGFVGHESLGNAHRYFPIIAKEAYQKQEIGNLLRQYFDNSHKNLVAYFAAEEEIDEAELREIIDLINKDKA